jgi:hypothetical protein
MSRAQWRALVALTLLCIALPAAPAQAGLVTGIDEELFQSPDPGVRDQMFDRTSNLRAGIVRLDVFWSSVALGQPANPADPDDPAYDFSRLDGAVQDANERGLDVLMTFLSAPGYARGADVPPDIPAVAWKPDPAALGAFARAVATRYSGAFDGLPRVSYFEAWNEPNLELYFAPQWHGNDPVGVTRYREALNAVYDNVKAVSPLNQVIAGGLAPYGDEPGSYRTRPLSFLRELFCLNSKLNGSKCPTKPKLDILSHHPINLSGGPTTSAIHPDDASTPDFKFVKQVMRKAEKANTVGGSRKHHQLWATEIWWESNPPDKKSGVPAKRQARWIEQAMYILWRQGAKVVIYFVLVDGQSGPASQLDTGLYLHDGKAKPSATAFRFPFVVDRVSRSRLRVWGKAPASGRLEVQVRKRGRWRTAKRLSVRAGSIYTTNVNVRGKPTLRAKIGGDFSLPWAVKGSGEASKPQ